MRASLFFWGRKNLFFKVILVGISVQLKLRKHPNVYIAIKWILNLLVITFLTTLTPLARVVLRNNASPYWHYPELRGYFTLKSLLHSELKQVMSLFTLGSARAVLVVALVYSFPDVFNVAIKWNLNILVITFLTTLTPLARVVLRNDASPSNGDNKRLVCVRGDQCHDHIKDIWKRED
jgi:hypothetical protein